MNRYLLGFLFLSLCSFSALAQSQQKRPMEVSDLAEWNRISRQTISNDGQWIAYVVGSEEGNPTLNLYNGVSKDNHKVFRATSPAFSQDNQFLTYTLKPNVDSVKTMRRAGKKKKDLPKDTLVVLKLADLSVLKVPAATDVKLPEKWSDWAFFKLEKEIEKDSTSKAKKRTDLIAHQLSTGEQVILPAGGDYVLAEERAYAAAISEGFEEEQEPGVFYFDANTKQWKAIHEQKGAYEQLSMDRVGAQVAFLADFDTTESRVDYFDLYHWDRGASAPAKIADRADDFLPENWLVSKNGRLSFSKSGQRLSFGIAPVPVLEDTTLLPEEKVSVEVWSYQDEQLYTEQEARLSREKNRTYTCVWLKERDKVIQLGSENIPDIQIAAEGDGVYALGRNPKPYQMQASWQGTRGGDVYLIEVATGKVTLLEKALFGFPQFSPNGKYVTWYSSPDTAWFSYAIDKQAKVQLTDNKNVSFYDEINDRPMLPSSYGSAGWTEDDQAILIYDRYDIWQVDPAQPARKKKLTNGRAEKIVSRYAPIDWEEEFINTKEPLMIRFVDEKSRQSGYAWLNIQTGNQEVVQQGDFSYGRFAFKAENANHWMFTKGNFEVYPDIYYSRNGLKNATKISEANPQQKEFIWGSMEIVSWTSSNGEKLEGMLAKPENFDPNKKYPMLVHFYEKSSQGVNNHRTPSVGTSINYHYYLSRGYLILNPDVPYEIGYPGESAYDAVVSGTLAMIDKGFVDKDNIGLQGHSWGGYQIAHIITRTNLFKCAESGAPVVNMFSAYGGIRWASGLSRMFQYEQTQSRIGGTIWEKPLRFIENSPIFFLDKVNTPVLILHNDEDGAVPWYQGIEFFVGMRRLGKPAWLVNYNGEAHGVRKFHNRKDWAMRMSQFFDHYLKEEPMPRWMDEGIPAVEKGLDQRLELMDKH
ncbi:MAG: prolyl oligopeptidase family serine peptidase [Bacteroidota bacterium]